MIPDVTKILLLISFIAIGCAHLPRPILPLHIKRINIPIFVNKTLRYGLEEGLTEETINTFILDGRLTVVDKDADGELRGEIISYSREALSYDDEGYVVEYRIWMRVSLLFYDLINNEVLWTDEIDSSINYVPYGSSLVGKGFIPEREEEAVDRLLKDLATRIVSRTLNGW